MKNVMLCSITDNNDASREQGDCLFDYFWFVFSFLIIIAFLQFFYMRGPGSVVRSKHRHHATINQTLPFAFIIWKNDTASASSATFSVIDSDHRPTRHTGTLFNGPPFASSSLQLVNLLKQTRINSCFQVKTLQDSTSCKKCFFHLKYIWSPVSLVALITFNDAP